MNSIIGKVNSINKGMEKYKKKGPIQRMSVVGYIRCIYLEEEEAKSGWGNISYGNIDDI